ncbi:MAG: glycosyltransferase family 2 protein [Clostridia bacterium]
MSILYLVVPCYNEEAVIDETSKRLLEKLLSMQEKNLVSKDSRILFVDDGSKDKTWQKLNSLAREYKEIESIKLAHNKGHQNAVLAGLMTAKKYCDCAISLDADLQDDIEVLDQFIEKFHEGNQVVYGVRNNRKKDSFFKKTTAQAFYKIMSMLGTEIIYNHADYRLMSKTALNALEEYTETNLFLRGIVPSIGFKSDCVYYERQERFAGESKYPLKKMINFAFDGISSFSVKPLKMISSFGIIISMLSVIALAYVFVSYFFGFTVNGWTATVASIWLLGGIQLLCLGVVGTYIGKIYSEVKRRPRYQIETYLKNGENNNDL